MIFPEEMKIEAAEAYRKNVLVPGFEHVNRNDWIDAWCCGVTYQMKKQQEEGWKYPDKGEYPENKKIDNLYDYNPLVLVFFYRYDDHGKAVKVYALDRWEPESNRWQNNRKDKIVAWQYLPGEPGEIKELANKGKVK